MRRALLPALATLAAVGCFRDPDPTDLGGREPSIHAVLEAGADSVALLIVRPPPSVFDPPIGVAGAEVRLLRGDRTLWLTEDPAGSCHYGLPESGGCYVALLDAPVAAGETFELDVRLPDGAAVTGRTTVPAVPGLSSPAAGLVLEADCGDPAYCYGRGIETYPYIIPVATFPIEWTTPADVRGIEVAVVSERVYLDGTEHGGDSCYLGQWFPQPAPDATSAQWGIPNIGCVFDHGARFDSIRAEVVVTGLNPEYAAYLEALESGQTVRVRSAAAGLDGAYGVFGATASARRSILLVRDPAPGPPPPAATP